MRNISVIIPIYNVEKYIEECLLSVMNQTLKNIEIVCVDDGSPDNSMEIVKRYAKEDDRIVIVEKENGGLSSARNAGILAATGEYVFFLDSDDYIVPEALEFLYNELSQNDLDSIFFDADSFYETESFGKDFSSYDDYYHRDALYEEVVSGQQLLANMVNNKDFRPSACLQLNRRSLLVDNEIFFYPGIIHEDNLFTLLVTLYSRRAKHVSKPFYMRRLRENSIMTNKDNIASCYGLFVSIRESLPKITELVKDEDILNAYIKRIVTMRNVAAKSFSEVEDKNCFYWDSTSDKVLFDLLIKDFESLVARKNRKIDRKDAKIKELKKTVAKLRKKLASAKKKPKSKGPLSRIRRLLRRIWRVFFKGNPKISVIMPVYNSEKYLANCLDSLCKQTLKDIEIICVDDASTDGSMDILQAYRKKDKRVRIFQQEHIGAGSARNLGIQKSKGEYLLFLDSDDYFHKNMCKEAYAQASSYNVDIVLFGAKRIDMQTGKQEVMGWVLREKLLPKNKTFNSKKIPDKLFQVTSNSAWNKLFRKKFVLENHLEFQNIKHTNDAFFTRTAMALAKKIVVLDKKLVTYRFNDGCNTQSVKSSKPLEFFKAFVAVKERLEKENLFDIYAKSYFQWVITETLSNYKTMKTEEAKEAIMNKVCSERISFFEHDNYPKTFFDDIANIEEFRNTFK